MQAAFSLSTTQLQGTREEQQDAIGHSETASGETGEQCIFAVVADGVGGHSHGKIASQLAVRTFLRAVQSQAQLESLPKILLLALNKANQMVLELGKAEGMQDKSCGTTLIAAAIQPESGLLHWIGVGDSRLYLIRDDRIIQVTVDGNYATYLKRMEMWAELAEEPLQGGEETAETTLAALTSYLGQKTLEGVDRSIKPFRLRPTDWGLICSDGLYNALSGTEILACLGGNPQSACDRIAILLAEKDLRSLDNTTVIIFGYGDRPEPRPLPIIATPAKAVPAPPPQQPPVKFWQNWGKRFSGKE